MAVSMPLAGLVQVAQRSFGRPRVVDLDVRIRLPASKVHCEEGLPALRTPHLNFRRPVLGCNDADF